MTAREEACALIDAQDSFDPHGAQAAGVELKRLLWLRCHGMEPALKVMDLLIHGGGFGLVALDAGDIPPGIVRRVPLAYWFRFQRAVEHTPTILLLIEQESYAKSAASLVLRLHNQAACWTSPGKQITQSRLLVGSEINVEILRSRLVLPQGGLSSARFETSTGWGKEEIRNSKIETRKSKFVQATWRRVSMRSLRSAQVFEFRLSVRHYEGKDENRNWSGRVGDEFRCVHFVQHKFSNFEFRLIIMSFACIHIPNFPVQAVVRNEPELRSRGVLIIEGKSESVVAANQAAREAGVRLGMIKLQVSQLPAIEIRPRSPAQEKAAHAALLDLSFSFSPRVEDTAADAVTLDLEGLERVCGPPDVIAPRLVQQAAELGLSVNVAIACNPDAALHAARGFAGITLIESGDTSKRLGPLPVSLLAPSEEILETLNRWGIRTFQALAALPTAELSERLGQPGVHLQTLARGTWLRPLIPVQPSLHFEEAMELEYAEEELEPLSFILGRMLGQLCARLAARGLAAHELRLGLELEDSGKWPVASGGHQDFSLATCYLPLATNH